MLDLLKQLQTGIESAQSVLAAIAASFAVVAFICLGIMYMGSSIPIVSDWKQNNPKAFTNVTIGLILTIIASGTGISQLISH
jgi:hypothetical protein